MNANKKEQCISCFVEIKEKDVIAINKKLLGKNITSFYCMDCLAEYLGVTVQDLLDKIEEFKEDGCDLFK